MANAHEEQEAKNLADKVLSYSKLPDCQLGIEASETVFIRFANNGITTSGYKLDDSVSISATTEDKRSGSATVSEWSDEALRHGVEQAEAACANLAAKSGTHAGIGTSEVP